MHAFRVGADQRHHVWDRNLPPVVEVDSGSTVTLEVTNASGGQIGPGASVETIRSFDLDRVNPVTGPVYVRGAEPGDTLVVHVVSVDVETWGWTANIPGFGLLADRFPKPHIRISRITDRYAELLPGIRVPVQPFVGTIGVAPAEAGSHPILPPGRHGGNMDIRQVSAGSRVWLPVGVRGALFSLGDTHAAQGDGEVCGTAVETDSTVTVRLELLRGRHLNSPIVETHPFSGRSGRTVATTGIGPDLFEAAREATWHMIEVIVRETGIDPLDAYLLASVAGDLKISEVVDAPNWVVTMHLEKDIIAGVW